MPVLTDNTAVVQHIGCAPIPQDQTQMQEPRSAAALPAQAFAATEALSAVCAAEFPALCDNAEV